MYCSWTHCVLCFFASSLCGNSEQPNMWSFTCWPKTPGLASLFTYFSCQYMQHAFSSRTQGYFCCVKICFHLSLDDYVSSMVMFLLLLFQFITTHSGNCQKHSAKAISFGLYKLLPTMMLGFLHRQPEYCSVFILTHVMSGPFGCRAGWGFGSIKPRSCKPWIVSANPNDKKLLLLIN